MMKYEFSRKTKNAARIILMIIIVLIAIYIAGIVTQVITQLMNFSRDTKYTIIFNPITNAEIAFNFKESYIAWIGEGILFILIFAYSMKMSDKRVAVGKSKKDRTSNFEYSSKNNYGSAKQANEAEIKKIMQVVKRDKFKDIEGDTTVLGYLNEKKKEVVAFPVNDWKKGISYNGNIAVCGNPGTMKSRAIVINYILQVIERGESAVVNDTKGEIYGITQKYAQEHGYTTKILNLVEQEYSDGWDILDEVKNSPEKATQLAATVIDNTGGKDNRDFWAQAEENCLKAVVLLKSIGAADISNKTGRKQTMRDVYEFVATVPMDEMDKTFAVLEQHYPRHPAIIPYKEFQRSDKLRPQILHGLGNRLQLFQDEQLSNVLGTKDIDFSRVGEEKCIYYLRFSDQNTTYRFVTSLFFAFMYIRLVEIADQRPERKLKVKVNIILDEACNIGEIPDFNARIATVRSRGIDTMIIFQDMPQIKACYPYTWESIIGCCSTLLFLGCGNETTTSEYISKLTGETTINVFSNSLVTGETSMRMTSSTGRGVVFTPDQIRSLPSNRMLVFFNHNPVMQLWKMDYTEHPNGKNLEMVNVTDNQTRVKRADTDYERMIIDTYRHRVIEEPEENTESSEEENNETTSATPAKPARSRDKKNNPRQMKIL